MNPDDDEDDVVVVEWRGIVVVDEDDDAAAVLPIGGKPKRARCNSIIRSLMLKRFFELLFVVCVCVFV